MENFAYRGNVAMVIKLLKQGANPECNLDEEGASLLNTLATEAAWTGLQHLGYLLNKNQTIEKKDINIMIDILYNAALSEKMYMLISDFVQ